MENFFATLLPHLHSYAHSYSFSAMKSTMCLALLAGAAEAASPNMLVNTLLVHDCKG